jgi:hypothetical protein
MNVCTAFDNKIFRARSFWESVNNKVLISLRKLWWCKKLMRTVLCSLYKQHFNTKWEASPLPDKSRNTSRIYRDYYKAFFISARGHDISPRADRFKGWYKNKRGLIMGMIWHVMICLSYISTDEISDLYQVA